MLTLLLLLLPSTAAELLFGTLAVPSARPSPLREWSYDAGGTLRGRVSMLLEDTGSGGSGNEALGRAASVPAYLMSCPAGATVAVDCASCLSNANDTAACILAPRSCSLFAPPGQDNSWQLQWTAPSTSVHQLWAAHCLKSSLIIRLELDARQSNASPLPWLWRPMVAVLPAFAALYAAFVVALAVMACVGVIQYFSMRATALQMGFLCAISSVALLIAAFPIWTLTASSSSGTTSLFLAIVESLWMVALIVLPLRVAFVIPFHTSPWGRLFLVLSIAFFVSALVSALLVPIGLIVQSVVVLILWAAVALHTYTTAAAPRPIALWVVGGVVSVFGFVWFQVVAALLLEPWNIVVGTALGHSIVIALAVLLTVLAAHRDRVASLVAAVAAAAAAASLEAGKFTDEESAEVPKVKNSEAVSGKMSDAETEEASQSIADDGSRPQ